MPREELLWSTDILWLRVRSNLATIYLPHSRIFLDTIVNQIGYGWYLYDVRGPAVTLDFIVELLPEGG